MRDDEGWNIAQLMVGVTKIFTVAFKGDTIRIRNADGTGGWVPIEHTFERKRPEENATAELFIIEDR